MQEAYAFIVCVCISELVRVEWYILVLLPVFDDYLLAVVFLFFQAK